MEPSGCILFLIFIAVCGECGIKYIDLDGSALSGALQGKAEYFPTCYKVQINILIYAREFGIKIEDDCGNEKTLQ